MNPTDLKTGTASFPLQWEVIVRAALQEDLAEGDITTDNLPELSHLQKTALLRVRQDCVVSGLTVAIAVFKLVDPSILVTVKARDGETVKAGTTLATVSGPMASILKAERVALNFMQHLSGIATETSRYAAELKGLKTRITHTRKTTPGLRVLERQAVIDGGGAPHRFNLGSCVMLKDNHLQALADTSPSPIQDAVRHLRSRISHTQKIEVEADRLEQVEAAAAAGADIILLDNMPPGLVAEAVRLVNGRSITEASGGVTLATVRQYGETGVDYVSTSKITLGVPAIDIGLDLD